MKRRGFLGTLAGAAAAIPIIGPALIEGLGKRDWYDGKLCAKNWPTVAEQGLIPRTNCRCMITALTDPLILDVGDNISINGIDYRLTAADCGVLWEGMVTKSIIFFEADGTPVSEIQGIGDDGRRMRCEFTRGPQASLKCWITQDHGAHLWIPEDGQGWQIEVSMEREKYLTEHGCWKII